MDTKPVANYFVFLGLFSLLEVYEVTEGIEMCKYDPNSIDGLRDLLQYYIVPSVAPAPPHNMTMLRWACDFYSITGTAPLCQLQGECQELSLPDVSDSSAFASTVRQILFPHHAPSSAEMADFTELLRRDGCEMLFSRPLPHPHSK